MAATAVQRIAAVLLACFLVILLGILLGQSKTVRVELDRNKFNTGERMHRLFMMLFMNESSWK